MGNWWHIKNWFRVGHNISWKLNFYTLNGFLCLYKPFQTDFFYSQAQKKHDYVIKYLSSELKEIIDRYKHVSENTEVATERYIWTLWWQGEENAPPLIKACINSIKRNSNGAKVVVITKDNYEKYIKLPSFIFEKREKGYISFAQLSDIFRFTLLKEYGGLWLDSTIFVSQKIPQSYFQYALWTQHTKWEQTAFVQHNMYHGFTIAAKKNSKLANFMYDCFIDYWSKHDTLVDYLMIDYLIYIAYQNFPDIKNEIDSLPYSSERLYDLVHILNKPFNKPYFDKLCDECIFSKLDWHKNYKDMSNRKMSYYAFIKHTFLQ